MKKELQEKALEMLSWVEQAKDFTLEQAPLFIKELVELHFMENAINTLVGLLGLLLLLVLTVYTILVVNKKLPSGDKVPAITCLLLLVLPIGGLLVNQIIKTGMECCKAKYAPRVLVIDKLRSL